MKDSTLMLIHRSRSLLVAVGLVLILLPSPAPAQSRSSVAGLVVRTGWGPTSRIDGAHRLGLQLEVFPEAAFVPRQWF
jgi:hypothetical protein